MSESSNREPATEACNTVSKHPKYYIINMEHATEASQPGPVPEKLNDYITGLPAVVHQMIFKLLDPEESTCLGLTNKIFYRQHRALYGTIPVYTPSSMGTAFYPNRLYHLLDGTKWLPPPRIMWHSAWRTYVTVSQYKKWLKEEDYEKRRRLFVEMVPWKHPDENGKWSLNMMYYSAEEAEVKWDHMSDEELLLQFLFNRL